jgi:hypothetical protein
MFTHPVECVKEEFQGLPPLDIRLVHNYQDFHDAVEIRQFEKEAI